MTGAQAVAAALACQGVRCVFGIPGAQTNELWDAFKARAVPYLLVAHEASASVMADASARVTGEPGVFSVVPGPGLTNALTGIGEALADSIPVVAHHHRHRSASPGTDRPGSRAGQCRYRSVRWSSRFSKRVIKRSFRARSSRPSSSPEPASPGRWPS